MRKSKTSGKKSKSSFSFGTSKRKSTKIVEPLNVQIATFKELDTESSILREQWSKVFNKYRKAREDNRSKRNETFDDLWKQLDTDNMSEEEWDTAWKDMNERVDEEFDAKDEAIEHEYENKLSVIMSKRLPIDDAIMERFIKPKLRRDIERGDPIPLTEFRNMVEGGSFGVSLELEPDQNLVSDLNDEQLSSLVDQTQLIDIMDTFIFDHGFTKKEEEKYGEYLDWSYPEQYDTIGGAGIDPEMDFWMHINQSAETLKDQRVGKKVLGVLGDIIDTISE